MFSNPISEHLAQTVHLTLYFLSVGMSVIIDDLNLDQKDVDYWKAVAKKGEAKVQIIDLRKVKFDTLIQRHRDNKINYKVPEMVNLALKHDLYPKPKKKFVICDLDMTLADCSKRLKHIVGKKRKDYKKFFEEISTDSLRESCFFALQDYAKAGHDIFFLTDRPESTRSATEKWLADKGIFATLPINSLIMRPNGDDRPASKVKQDLIDTYFLHEDWIEVIIDDDQATKDMVAENYKIKTLSI
jgi:predicted secreted acid phosphatase